MQNARMQDKRPGFMRISQTEGGGKIVKLGKSWARKWCSEIKSILNNS